jgi:hypothetical protein
MNLERPLVAPSDYVEVQFVGINYALAQWTRETDRVVFDWPKIEEVALDAAAPLQGLAKILLAARDTGRNDPLPGFVD